MEISLDVNNRLYITYSNVAEKISKNRNRVLTPEELMELAILRYAENNMGYSLAKLGNQSNEANK